MKHILHHYLNNAPTPITVTVIGSGGNGSEIMQNLATINYALTEQGHSGLHVTLWDDTIVRQSNKGRQRFFESDYGRYKATVIIERINRAYGFSWEAECSRWTERARPSNIVITCVDTMKPRISMQKALETQKIIYQSCKMQNKEYNRVSSLFYWMDLGNGKDKGQISLASICGELVSTFDLHPDYADHDQPDEKSCSFKESVDKQGLFTNRGMALVAAEMLWKLLSQGHLDINATYLNMGRLRMTTVPVKEIEYQLN